MCIEELLDIQFDESRRADVLMQIIEKIVQFKDKRIFVSVRKGHPLYLLKASSVII